ncbi:hypothetical protein VP1G_10719 [Cytospora mali]|uniref:Uncharacterized protein n=1 Tax=Cytospora mali TaxID=578113 RepID=A0A194UTV8_CYTMA|nr:hypothetical protein VP1G_10719 [Valsa mali var. pyri (nom. inval.)]
MENIYQILVSLITVVIVMAASVYVMKAKAEAEAKQMQVQGLKRGEDFADSELKGNKQAGELQEGIGSLGGLKKSL